jgi:serine protease Do
MRLKKITMALAAAGFGAVVATGYQHLDTHAVSLAQAAVTAPAFSAPPVAPTAAAHLPDFTALVQKTGAAVVNISTVGKAKQAAFDPNEIDPNDPFGEFLRRFGVPQGPNGMQPRMQPSRGVGSGFIVSPDGYIVTNAHVVDDASEVTVKLTDRREFTAKVIGQDKRTDIALLKIDAKNLPALDLSSPPPVKQGEWVIAIGSPFGFENSVSAGIVSGVHRALPGGQMTPFIQTDVAVNPGNSGGPLLNAEGQVVGVNSQIYSRTGGFMGLSFAIPADVAAKVADQLRVSGKVAHGRIGVGIQPLDQALAQSFGLPDANGALVGTVEKDSPAARAGFKTGDVIRSVNGQKINDTTDVTSRIGNMAPGTKANIEVWRDGKLVSLAPTIAPLSDENVASNSTPATPDGGKLGLATRPLTPDEKSQVGHDGVVVENVTGPAALAGIQPGDLIVGVGSQKVKSVDELRKLIDKSGKSVALLVERDGRQIYVPVRVG